MMRKPFEVEFKIDSNVLAILFICWKFKFPAADFLTFYQMYGVNSLFIFKALSCNKRITLNDNAFTNILEECKKLHKQILAGISLNIKIKQLEVKVKSGGLIDEDIPEHPILKLEEFSEDFQLFIKYLVKNVNNIFSETFTLKLSTRDLYQQIK